MVREFVRPFDYAELSIWQSCEHRRVEPHQIAFPPVSRATLFLHRRKPVLPQNRPDIAWRRLRKWISLKQGKYIRIVFQETLFCQGNKIVLLPIPERSEPKIPFEPRLVRSIDAGSFVECLRLVPKNIGSPALPIVRALELNLVPAAGHYGEQSISVGDAKWLQCYDRSG